MDYKSMCVQQGYIPSTCKMDWQMCWLLVQEGKDPCNGCNYNRKICNGRHAQYEDKTYRFNCFMDFTDDVNRKKREKEQEIKYCEKRKRQQRHASCNPKIVLSTVVNVGRDGKPIVEVKVNDLIAERGYMKRFDGDLQYVAHMIRNCVGQYHVQQIQCETNGYGIGVYDALADMDLDVDIVPLIYTGIRLN